MKLARMVMDLPSKPSLYLIIPIPAYNETWEIQKKVVNGRFPVLIPEIAQELELPLTHVIDLFTKMGGYSQTYKEGYCNELNCDGIHPDANGERDMADEVYKRITAKDEPI